TRMPAQRQKNQTSGANKNPPRRTAKSLYGLRPNNCNSYTARSGNSSRLSCEHSVINNMLERQNMNGHISPIIQFAHGGKRRPPTVMNKLHSRQLDLIRSKNFHTHRCSPY
ncbi:hypothetical protein, partial [Paraburkholderia hospita]|uniref:hypothetical protein n=1 Tax=Paraburkholderia hospita TaxID=169430 RepID=UPI001A99454A